MVMNALQTVLFSADLAGSGGEGLVVVPRAHRSPL